MSCPVSHLCWVGVGWLGPGWLQYLGGYNTWVVIIPVVTAVGWVGTGWVGVRGVDAKLLIKTTD